MRCDSYQRALTEHGLPASGMLIQDDAGSSREKAYHKTAALLGLSERPTAILAASDIAAVSAIWAIRDGGLRVPDDMAVIGVGNIPEGGITRPPLTTVGPTSCDWTPVTELLFSRVESRVPLEGRVHLSPWTFILRGSA
jgi:DNA-binding LacI/PurR family transcriptional regulator